MTEGAFVASSRVVLLIFSILGVAGFFLSLDALLVLHRRSHNDAQAVPVAAFFLGDTDLCTEVICRRATHV